MTDHTLARLEDQFNWYDNTARRSQRLYRIVKVLQLAVAAAVPVTAAAGAGTVTVALIGAVILVLEGVQGLFAWQQNWISYRSTASALQTEQHLFLAKAGPYARATDPARLLAERVEGLLASERASWFAMQQPQGAQQAIPDTNGTPLDTLTSVPSPMPEPETADEATPGGYRDP
jgi:hypothetical protein